MVHANDTVMRTLMVAIYENLDVHENEIIEDLYGLRIVYK